MKLARPLHELSLKEQAELLQPIVIRIQQENLKKGLYNVYQAGNAKNVLTRDYSDRKERVRVDAATGQTHTLRRIAK